MRTLVGTVVGAMYDVAQEIDRMFAVASIENARRAVMENERHAQLSELIKGEHEPSRTAVSATA